MHRARRSARGCPCRTGWPSSAPGSPGSAWRSRSSRRVSTTSWCSTGRTAWAGRGVTTAIRVCLRHTVALVLVLVPAMGLEPAVPSPRRDPGLPARAGRRAPPRPAPALWLRGGGGRIRGRPRRLGRHPGRWPPRAGRRGRLCRRPARPCWPGPISRARPGSLAPGGIRPSGAMTPTCPASGWRWWAPGPAPSSSCPRSPRWPGTSTSPAQRTLCAAQGRPALPCRGAGLA